MPNNWTLVICPSIYLRNGRVTDGQTPQISLFWIWLLLVCLWIVSAHCHCHFRAVIFWGVVEKNENFSTVAPIQKHSTASFAFWWQSSSSFTLHKPGKMCANNNNNNNNRKKQDSKNAWKKIENALWHAIECRWFVFTPNIFFEFYLQRLRA